MPDNPKNIVETSIKRERVIVKLCASSGNPGTMTPTIVGVRKKIIRERFFAEQTSSISEFQKLKIANGSKKAALIIYPHLDNGLEQPFYYKWKPLDFFWLLTRDLSHEIRGGIRLVNNFSHLLPSLDNPELTKSRVQRTKSFCNDVPCYYFQGSLDQVAEYIPAILKQENA